MAEERIEEEIIEEEKVELNSNIVDETSPEELGVEIEDLLDIIEDVDNSNKTTIESGGEEEPTGQEPEPKEDVVEKGEQREEEKKPIEKVEELPEELSEVQTLQAQVEKLTGIIEGMAGSASKEPTPAPKAEPKPEVVSPIPPVDMVELFKDMDFDSVMDTKEGFMQFFQSAMTAVQNQTVQNVMSNLPTVVGGHMQRQTALKDVAREFYGQYPELKTVKRYVGQVANEISATEPDLQIGEVLTKTAAKVKETLGIKDGVVQQEKVDAVKPKPKTPALPGANSVKKRPGPSNSLQSEIDDVINE